jgi:D-alanyl-D-alanine dipeptidase
VFLNAIVLYPFRLKRRVSRYFSGLNFVGDQVRGYEDSSILITREANAALLKAQDWFRGQGFSLVVYDAYRPPCAVAHFVEWAKELDDTKTKKLFYPRVAKDKVFSLGYVSDKSSHCFGSTVDVTLIKTGLQLMGNVKYSERQLSDGFEFYYIDDGTVDMGSHFDFFDEASWWVSHYSYPTRQTILSSPL